MLKQRIITALILIPIVLVILFFASLRVFCILTAGLVIAASTEWAHLMPLKSIKSRFAYLLLIILLMVCAYFMSILLILAISVIWWFLTIPLIAMYPRNQQLLKNVKLKGVMGILILVPCWAALCFIRSLPIGAHILLFLLVLVWSADAAAYFVGKKWGKHKLAPNVSPGKSVEGFLGAVFFSILFVIVFFYITRIEGRLWPWGLLLAIVTVIFSVIGDLFESMIKRVANVKDSGNLLPGHGGLLDRIDSLTAAVPIFVSCAYLIWLLFLFRGMP